jgi:hypothetical protein
MCYGDVDYGRDGYYREYMDEWERQARLEQTEQYDDTPEPTP